jgi:hypothetical protein
MRVAVSANGLDYLSYALRNAVVDMGGRRGYGHLVKLLTRQDLEARGRSPVTQLAIGTAMSLRFAGMVRFPDSREWRSQLAGVQVRGPH